MRTHLRRSTLCLTLALWVSSISFATPRAEAGLVSIQDIRVLVPDGWKVHQEAMSGDTVIVGFAKDDDYLTLYASPRSAPQMKEVFANGSEVVVDVKEERIGPFDWKVLQTQKTSAKRATYHVKSFMTEFRGRLYYGYSRSGNARSAVDNVQTLLHGVHIPLASRSLTRADYAGKKYYFGWGAAMGGDPSSMHNEVKYDVKHTHDIFTAEVGGDYAGKQIIGSQTSAAQIREEWKRLGKVMTTDDMYVQYSSGHGSHSGLVVGVNYNEIRDNALAYPAKEIIIFTMACHSGGLVNAFNAKKNVWSEWQKQGRTLMVMSSSTLQQTSSTGPGTDKGEPGGPSGSAGSAFGHALWKALIGGADGFSDGVKDGFLSLGEIRDFAIARTQKLGHHTPVVTGAYNPSLIMNRVPSREFVQSFVGGTDGLSEDQIESRIAELNEAMQVN